jgi:hypothetical protein
METDKNPNSYVEVLAKAIRRRSVVSFLYRGTEQMVAEPIVLGIHKETNKMTLRCYKSYPPHISDSKENWYLCDLDEISHLKVTPLRTKDFRKGAKTILGDMAEVIESSSDYVKG